MLTKKQKNFFDKLKDFVERREYFPSFREIAKLMDLSSTNSVWKYIKKLEQEGYISKEKGRYSLTMKEDNFISIPFVGFVPAGPPFEVFSELGEEIELPSWFADPSSGRLVAFKVKGMSMKDAYINDGDIVVLKLTDRASSGDTIVASIGEANSITLKKLKILKDGYLLIPENSDYEPIKVKELKIIGKVIGILRKYD